MTTGPSPTERRQTPRYGCAGQAEVVVPGRGLRYTGEIADLSEGGCFLRVNCGLERGTGVEIWMKPDGQPLRIAAYLVVKRADGIGCKFNDLTARKLEQVRWLIAELAAEAAGERKSGQPGDGIRSPSRPQGPEVWIRRT